MQAGVDEAGRGPLVGHVVAAAVILNPQRPIAGLTDSKKLSEKQREQLALVIYDQAIAWAIGESTVAEIDTLNILQATLLAMQRAVLKLSIVPNQVLIDGNRAPLLPMPTLTIIKGDLLEPAISAASILAKTYRDAQMRELDQRYPQYGFAQHKGYATAAHLAALKQYGVLAEHRRSFAPVRAAENHVQLLI